MNDVKSIQKHAEEQMKKTISVLKETFTKTRTGRASTGILDSVMVSYYGSDTALTQVATVAATDARTLTITPWEDAIVPAIEKAILKADLGLNPVTAGKVIRVPMPALTEESRIKVVKTLKEEAEKSRIAIRNLRQDANNKVKKLSKDKVITEDEEKGSEKIIQKMTDQYISEIDTAFKHKEEEVMTL